MGEGYYCGTCDVRFADAAAQREHAKSEWHVYRLRCRIAEPGTTVTPPAKAEFPGDDTIPEDQQSSTSSSSYESDFASEDENEVDTADAYDQAPEFVPGQCLFCNSIADDFDSNVEHMRQSHSFTVPYQSHLNVESETFVWYLHMVVHGYHECLSCGARKGSAEGAKQHMTAKGHCRVDVAGEIADFYTSEYPKTGGEIEGSQKDGTSLRLASGKVLGSRAEQSTLRPSTSSTDPTKASSRAARIAAGRSAASKSDTGTSTTAQANSSNTLQRRDRRAEAVTYQLSKLSANDQRSLAHLPSSEQRSLLATRKKQLSRAQIEERRARARVERLGNRTLMKHFVPDVPARANG